MRRNVSRWIFLAAMLPVMAVGCAVNKTHNLPPAQRLLEPGPGVGGPGPGVLPPGLPPSMMPMPAPIVQVLFNRPEGMQVQWDVSGAGMFDSMPLVVPGRQNFVPAAMYWLKVTNIAGREGVELYPTLEIAPPTPRSANFLAHSALPVEFTADDIDQVLSGNFVTKVVYLPDPAFQELAVAGVGMLVSTRLDPGLDPIVEADRRGTILAILRIGDKDIEMPGGGRGGMIEPVTFTSTGRGPAMGMPAGPGMMGPGMMGPGMMGPGMMGPGMMGGPAGTMPHGHVAGVTTSQWGMPMSGTPIGLPGPPHVPLGAPAGLQKHVMKNFTRTHLPPPTEAVRIHVRHQPGYSYPRPADSVWIREQTIASPLPAQQQPHATRHQEVK